MRVGESVRRARAFAHAARRYWIDVYPLVRRELNLWRERALTIPDPVLREAALSTQRLKAGHSEGAAAFAVLVPRTHRPDYVKLLVAFELLADFLDTVSEAETDDIAGNNLQLHRSMSVALGLEPLRDDYYALHSQDEDGGYLEAHISVCREITSGLPAYDIVKEPLKRLVTCYAESQALHHIGASQPPDARQAKQLSIEIARYPELGWHEVVVAGGSTLAMLALLVAAGDSKLTERDVELTVSMYYPSASSLHIMLDSLVDLGKDRANGDVNPIDTYDSWEEACDRLAFLASTSRSPAVAAPGGELHEVIVAGMVGYYLAQPEAWQGVSSTMSRGILEVLGPMTRLAMLVHRTRRIPTATRQPVAL